MTNEEKLEHDRVLAQKIKEHADETATPEFQELLREQEELDALHHSPGYKFLMRDMPRPKESE